MSCKITIIYPHPKEEAVEKLKTAVLNNGGRFSGDTTEGHLSVDTPLGFFEARYFIKDDTIDIDVLRKPFIISCKRIEEEIKKYLENDSQLKDLETNLFTDDHKAFINMALRSDLYDNNDAIKLQKIIASYTGINYTQVDLDRKIENTYVASVFRGNFCDDLCNQWKQLKPSVIFGGMFDSIKTGKQILELL